jgi:hypothetical protein
MFCLGIFITFGNISGFFGFFLVLREKFAPGSTKIIEIFKDFCRLEDFGCSGNNIKIFEIFRVLTEFQDLRNFYGFWRIFRFFGIISGVFGICWCLRRSCWPPRQHWKNWES